MTAAVLTYNVPILPSPYDATLTNATSPGTSEMATGELNSTSVLNAVTYNWLHNAATANLYLEQQLGLFMPYNPASTGGSLVACPQGGVVSVKDNSTGYTQFYVALTIRPVGFADPSTDATNFGLINFANLYNSGQPGDLKAWAGTTAPAGWLQCPTAQTNISRSTYANLFTAIGTTWGPGNGTTTFGMPWFPSGYTLLSSTGGGVGLLSNGAVISHNHSIPGLGIPSVGLTGSVDSANIDHTHNFAAGTNSGSGGANSGNVLISVPTTATTGGMNSNQSHQHGVSGLATNASTTAGGTSGSTGGTPNYSAGMNVMLCVKY